MPDSHPRRPITQVDVARQAGVSRSVVSYVLNDGPRTVSVPTRRRVLDAIERLGYRPNRHAQMLIHEKWDSVAAKQIGVIIGDVAMFRRPYYGAILAGIHEEAHERSLHIRFVRLFSSLKNPALLNQLVHRTEISGLVLVGLELVLNDDADRLLLDRIVTRVPNTVCVEWQEPGLSSVTFDRRGAAVDAARHLLGAGRSVLAYVGPADDRVAGFSAAVAEAGALHAGAVGAFDASSGQEATRTLIARGGERPTGIVAGSDEVAFGVLAALREHGLDVPGDVAVVSIDNIDLSAFASPSLTTVDVPKEALGRRSIQVLVEQRVRNSSAPTTITLPASLVVRDSCGTASAGVAGSVPSPAETRWP